MRSANQSTPAYGSAGSYRFHPPGQRILSALSVFQSPPTSAGGSPSGRVIAATRRSFDRIYSIEFDPRLARLAQKRFAPFPHIRILQGDSQTLIPALLATLGEPTLFWLDAGYYGWAGSQGDNTRLSAELEAILRHSLRNVVLLDDARGLDGRNGTLTVAQLTSYIESQFPGRSVAVLHDILRITPSSEANVRSPQPP